MIEFLADVAQFIIERWNGPTGVLVRLRQHMELSAAALATAVVLAMPPAAWLGHTRRGARLVTALVNAGRALPTFGVVALALPITIRLANHIPFMSSGIGFAPIYVALVVLAIPPIFIHTHAGVMAVDRDVIEAARGMGVRDREILRQVEMPLASPVILSGLRVTAVQVVSTAPLGALVGFGGLGRFIIDGFAIRDTVQVFAGALLVAAAALLTDVVFGVLERRTTPGAHRRKGSPVRLEA